tara:strand:+ start:4131 stop:4988 length:858 start_codon:yes stop_codon:yes gene_type:complete
MKGQPPREYRVKEFLRLLLDQGAITAKAIALMADPPMRDKKVYEALLRLRRRGLVRMRTEKVVGRPCAIYQLNQDAMARQKVAEILDVDLDSTLQPHFRYREILHNDGCALLAHNLKKHFPEAEVIRDFEFENSPLAQKIMITNDSERDLKPDVLLVFKDTTNKRLTSISFEFEKTRKSNARLKAKLKKYASQSRVDGVVYICDEDRIKEAIQGNFESAVLPRALRVKHYSDYFLMFTKIKNININLSDTLYGLNQKTVSIDKWISFLRQFKNTERRNTNIAIGG